MQFNIKRMLLAILAAAIGFSEFRSLGIAGMIASSVVGLSLGASVLIITRPQFMPMIRTAIISVCCGFFGFASCPLVSPPYQAGDEFSYIAAGISLGFLLGVSITAYEAWIKEKYC